MARKRKATYQITIQNTSDNDLLDGKLEYFYHGHLPDAEHKAAWLSSRLVQVTDVSISKVTKSKSKP